MDYVLAGRSHATTAKVNGFSFVSRDNDGDSFTDSVHLAGTLRFDADTVTLPSSDAPELTFRMPFVMTGTVRGYAEDDISRSTPLFDVALTGRGTTTAEFHAEGGGRYDVHGTYAFAAPVPEPTSLLLLGTGIVGLAARMRHRARARRE